MYRMAEALAKLTRFEVWFFTERRIRLFGSGVLVAYAISLAARLYWHDWLLQENGKPLCTDFGTIWVTGILRGRTIPRRCTTTRHGWLPGEV